jgi:hypothetical protein
MSYTVFVLRFTNEVGENKQNAGDCELVFSSLLSECLLLITFAVRTDPAH